MNIEYNGTVIPIGDLVAIEVLPVVSEDGERLYDRITITVQAKVV